MNVPRLVLRLLLASSLLGALRGDAVDAPERRAASFRLWFRGTIGGKAPIRLELAREADRLTGRYYRETGGKDVALSGTMRDDGTAECAESAGGTAGATFRGKVVERDEPQRLLAFEGKWSRSEAEKALPFVVVEESPQLPAEFRPMTDVARRTFAGGGSGEAVFPRVAGTRAPGVLKLNALVREAATKAIEEGGSREIRVFSEWDHLSADLASVALTTRVHDAGGPDVYVTSSINVDLRTGAAFGVADLFRSAEEGAARLARACVARLRTRLGPGADARWIEKGAAPAEPAYRDAGFAADGIVVRFPPSAVAPLADGAQVVTVPWDEVADLLRAESPVSGLAAARPRGR